MLSGTLHLKDCLFRSCLASGGAAASAPNEGTQQLIGLVLRPTFLPRCTDLLRLAPSLSAFARRSSIWESDQSADL